MMIIGHRGASAFRPEHTLAAYELAIAQGADFIEPDLVITRDKVLIARHENELSSTTDVASRPQFSNRFTTKIIDGNSITGWFAEDFTLAEIKTLRAVERIPETRPHNIVFNGLFKIPTLTEIITLVNQQSAEIGRTIGIYPETKHPTFFAKEGKHLDGSTINVSLGQVLIDTLVANKFTEPNRLFIQSFELENLIELKQKIMPKAGVDIPLVQLFGSTQLPTNSSFARPYDIFYNAQQNADMTAIYGSDLVSAVGGILDMNTGYGHLDNAEALNCISRYANGVGCWKNNLLSRVPIKSPVTEKATFQLIGEVTDFVDDTHKAGLVIHVYTLRPEEKFLSVNEHGIPQTLTDEVHQLINIGVDGVFCDDPHTCRAMLNSITPQASHSCN
ncbi:MAG: glycerophosphodiester phosphodiesterase family protein [Microcystaceae cyanobacterium]